MGQFINNAGAVAGSIVTIIGLLTLVLFNPIKRSIQSHKKEKKDLVAFRSQVLEKLDTITDDIADLQYERLSQAHDFYISQGWCPTSKKYQLCNMYKSYTNKGRNHLSGHYEKEIMELRDKPELKGE